MSHGEAHLALRPYECQNDGRASAHLRVQLLRVRHGPRGGAVDVRRLPDRVPGLRCARTAQAVLRRRHPLQGLRLLPHRLPRRQEVDVEHRDRPSHPRATVPRAARRRPDRPPTSAPSGSSSSGSSSSGSSSSGLVVGGPIGRILVEHVRARRPPAPEPVDSGSPDDRVLPYRREHAHAIAVLLHPSRSRCSPACPTAPAADCGGAGRTRRPRRAEPRPHGGRRRPRPRTWLTVRSSAAIRRGRRPPRAHVGRHRLDPARRRHHRRRGHHRTRDRDGGCRRPPGPGPRDSRRPARGSPARPPPSSSWRSSSTTPCRSVLPRPTAPSPW